MKNIFKKIILIAAAAVLTFSAVACGGSSWKKEDVVLKDWGKVKYNGGFIAQTENYVYYINGVADNEADNSFGTPVKGALVAASLSDIAAGKEEVTKCVVVPKLFASQDYNMGVYISGDYVYYATPSTDKTASGKVANTELQFMRTKLDGTSSESYLKAGTVTDEYRITEKDGVVYIVVYDSANSQILCYNTANKTQTVVAKTDAKTDGDESLDSYKFTGRDYADTCTVVFTNTVYTEKYDEEAAKADDYSRTTASFNRVYAFTVGSESATLVLDGEEDDSSYSLTLADGEYLFYSKTLNVSLISDAVNYAVSLKDLLAKSAATEVYNTDYVIDTNVIVSPEEIYTFISSSGIIKKVSATDAAKASEQSVAKINTNSSVLFKEGDYIYYTNENTELARVDITDYSSKSQTVSDAEISTDWYKPQVMDGYAYYSDNTTGGCTYIKAVSLSDSNKKASYDEDDETKIDHYYFKENISLAIMSEEDEATFVLSKINEITASLNSGRLVFDVDDDENIILDQDNLPVIASITTARSLYEKLNSDQKKTLKEESETLKEYEKAYELSRTLYRLNDFDKLTASQKDALKDYYKAAKSALEALDKDKNYTASTIKGLCVQNMLWYYQTANSYFSA